MTFCSVAQLLRRTELHINPPHPDFPARGSSYHQQEKNAWEFSLEIHANANFDTFKPVVTDEPHVTGLGWCRALLLRGRRREEVTWRTNTRVVSTVGESVFWRNSSFVFVIKHFPWKHNPRCSEGFLKKYYSTTAVSQVWSDHKNQQQSQPPSSHSAKTFSSSALRKQASVARDKNVQLGGGWITKLETSHTFCYY